MNTIQKNKLMMEAFLDAFYNSSEEEQITLDKHMGDISKRLQLTPAQTIELCGKLGIYMSRKERTLKELVAIIDKVEPCQIA